MTLKEQIEFEKEWLDEAGYTKANVIIALTAIRHRVEEQQLSEDGEKIRISEVCINRDELYKALDELKTICGTGTVEKAVTENNIYWAKWKIDKLLSDALPKAYDRGYDYGVKDWFASKTKPYEEIISRIEQVRDNDKNVGEYPYNRCIEIIREVMG